MSLNQIGLFDFFFLSMVVIVGFVAILLLGAKYFTDEYEASKKEKLKKGKYKYNGKKGPMAVRNK